MKLNTKIKLGLCAAVAGLAAGCTFTVSAPPPPSVEVSVPGPDVYISPATYIWDGNEYVGEYNGSYYYMTGGAWVICPPFIIDRFHGYERFHPDWRAHMVHNDHRLERRRPAHPAPRHGKDDRH